MSLPSPTTTAPGDDASAADAPARISWQRGIIYMLATTLCFACLDGIAKLMTAEVNVVQLVWGRYLFNLVIFGALIFSRAKFRHLLRTRRPGLQAWRSVALVASTFVFWWALMYLPLAEATVLGFAGPLMVTALSVPLLGEQVGKYRWRAVIVGLIGVVIIIRPGAGAMQWAALLPLLTALIYALYQIATRILSRYDDPMATAFFSPIGGVLITSALLPFFWTPMTLQQWGILALMGFLGGFGHYLLIRAFGAAPASVLAPFGYVGLLWTTVIGYVIWGDLPDMWTWVGAAIIIASGLYILHRERVRARERAPA
jgi:drug/metabolite transporter (DMT)-like permease